MKGRLFSALSSLLFVFVLWGGWLHSPTVANQGLCRRIRWVQPIDGHALQGHVITNLTLFLGPHLHVGSDCRNRCVMESRCVSINVGPPIKDKVICQLSDSDHMRHPEDLKPREGFVYRGTANSCYSNPCLHNATCLNGFTDNGFLCNCQAGYTGERCEKDVDECVTAKHKCHVNAVCANTHGSHDCTCMVGYTGDGYNCTDFDECTRNPCKNNGNCTNLVNGYNCSCAPGFNGTDCEEDIINECESNPCLNNGTCTDRVNGYNCSCLSVFYGERCEIEFIITSTILSSSYKYLNHLAQFLAPAPAAGNHSTWQLCYGAPNGGNAWSASDFHKLCDGKRDTLVIIREGQYAFGGYTDIPWESPPGFVHGFTPNAFIFSLKNTEALTPFKIMVNASSTAIIKIKRYGPIFGADIVITGNGDNSKAELGVSYPAPPGVQNKKTILAGTNSFNPDKVEVFFLG